jgi:hypothetical protein
MAKTSRISSKGETRKIELDAQPRVCFKPGERTDWIAPPAERERLGEVVGATSGGRLPYAPHEASKVHHAKDGAKPAAYDISKRRSRSGVEVRGSKL